MKQGSERIWRYCYEKRNAAKGCHKNIAKEKHISAQLVMQNFMLERLLERISASKYQKNFILKGGFLIAAMVSLDTRVTMDMDATMKGLPVNEQTIALKHLNQMRNQILMIMPLRYNHPRGYEPRKRHVFSLS